jgi:carbonic anhydrase
MDPRLQLPKALGHAAEEPFMLRNGGGRVTDDVLRGLVLCTRLMQVTEVGVIHHTDCRLQDTNERLVLKTGIDRDYMAFPDPVESILKDVCLLRDSHLLSPQVRVWGGLYNTEDHTVRVISGVHSYADQLPI